MNYTVIVAQDSLVVKASKDLEERVKKHLDAGWKPIGGVSISQSVYGNFTTLTSLSQAMIKE